MPWRYLIATGGYPVFSTVGAVGSVVGLIFAQLIPEGWSKAPVEVLLALSFIIFLSYIVPKVIAIIKDNNMEWAKRVQEDRKLDRESRDKIGEALEKLSVGYNAEHQGQVDICREVQGLRLDLRNRPCLYEQEQTPEKG